MITNLSLQQLFGARAYQDSDRLVINKGDLSNLSANATNTAETLLVAILLNAHSNFEGILVDENFESIIDETGQSISYDHSQLYEKINLWFWKRQIIVGKILDTFVINCFISPPTTYGEPFNPNDL
jgi:hypothetical protein